METKIHEIRGHFGLPSQDASKEAKWRPRNLKMEATWSRKGAKWSHNGGPRGSKRIVVVVVVAAGRAQLASERSERASGAIDVTGMRVTCVTRSPCNALPVHLPRQVLGVSFFAFFFVVFLFQSVFWLHC